MRKPANCLVVWVLGNILESGKRCSRDEYGPDSEGLCMLCYPNQLLLLLLCQLCQPSGYLMRHLLSLEQLFLYLIFLRFYLFIRDRKRGRDTGRGRSRLHAGSPMWDSILGLRGHILSQRHTQLPNHPGIPVAFLIKKYFT